MNTLFAVLFSLSLSALAMPSLAADEAACKTMLESIDVNKDGSVNATEGKPFMEKATPETAKFDADTDGKLSTTEFMDACKADTAGIFVMQ